MCVYMYIYIYIYMYMYICIYVYSINDNNISTSVRCRLYVLFNTHVYCNCTARPHAFDPWKPTVSPPPAKQIVYVD